MKIEDIDIEQVEVLIKIQIVAGINMLKFEESSSDYPEKKTHKANILSTTVDSIATQLNELFDFEYPYANDVGLRDSLFNAIENNSIDPAMKAIRIMYTRRLVQERDRMEAIQEKINMVLSLDE